MLEQRAAHPIPILIKVASVDNVAVVGTDGGLEKGTVLPDGMMLLEGIPEGHKVALRDMPKGEAIIRYGQTIGYAAVSIPKGAWVEESLVEMPAAPSLDALPICDKVPVRQAPLEGWTFMGYRNEDGSVGTRNLLGINISVQCVTGVVRQAVKRIKDELLPKYPKVDGVIVLSHEYGCGVAINAPQSVVPIRTLRNLARNPNLAGETMIIGLGCEKFTPESLAEGIASADILTLQNNHGYEDMVRTIMQRAEVHLGRLNGRSRSECPVSDLVVGMQCGGSDALSGVTANPAVGFATDLIVRAGGTVLFSEVTEVRDGIDRLTSRAANEEVARGLIREMKWYDDYLENGQADRSANTSPGNKKGGLANIVEKALGSIAKSGSLAIDGVLSPGERVNQKGLIFAATPASDFICGTLQMASGIQLQVFTTGRGTPYGLEMIPVIKVGTRNSLAEQWPDLIDLNAGRIATGEATIEELGWELFKLILDVASGRTETWATKWGLYNDLCLFNPAPVT